MSDFEKKAEEALEGLKSCLERERFKGYEPQDILNSWIPFSWGGKWVRFIANQVQIRNPVNIRFFLGIRKGWNAKAMGLLLKAYSILYAINKREKDRLTAEFLYRWLIENYSRGYSGYCWGYNFSWQDRIFYIRKNEPNIVATAFVCLGLYQYYLVSEDREIIDIIEQAGNFMLNDLPRTEDRDGICFSYSTGYRNMVYNANMLGCRVLALLYRLTGKEAYLGTARKCADWTLKHQAYDGYWYYRISPGTGQEKKQIDFHQGFILDSLRDFIRFTGINDEKYSKALEMGALFYRTHQFSDSGRSFFRVPKKYPVDIHNQSQGIITFAQLGGDYLDFACRIAEWTIDNMYDRKRGYFYYRKHRGLVNRIPYIKRSHAWMFLALVTLKAAMGRDSSGML